MYYKLLYVEELPETNDTLVVTKHIFEPSSLSYLWSFFGLLAPYPKIKEQEIRFVGHDNKWVDISIFIECPIAICVMLNRFVLYSRLGMSNNLIGTP